MDITIHEIKKISLSKPYQLNSLKRSWVIDLIIESDDGRAKLILLADSEEKLNVTEHGA